MQADTLPLPAPVLPEPAPSLLLDSEQVAHLLAISLRHLRRLLAAGELPEPLRLGRSLRWRRADIEGFVAAGCDPVRWRAGRRAAR